MTDFYRKIGTDYEAQLAANDPVLFPGKMPMEMLEKIPPCIVMTSECDVLVRDSYVLIDRLKEAGKYLDSYF